MNWPTQSQQQQTSMCICLTGQFQDNFKVRLENALTHTQTKNHQTIKEPVYLTGCHCGKENQGDLTLCQMELNSTVVRDAFPLPHIDEAPQAVHNCQWFMSFDLVQGYLQIPVEEADIQIICI